ncbi:histidine kinase [Paraconexibacter sp. AEG42_29]|uniref:sensor histidine kinase n=1 Tax=Paraconexibacter sp. AEG42_29 TaxID=2997339 RepID=UPI00339D8D39
MASRIRNFAWNGPAADALLLVGVAAALLLDAALCPEGKGVSPLGVVAAAVTVVPLWWRARTPLCLLPVTGLGLLLCLATLKPVNTIALPGMIALYAAARYGDRRRSLIVAALGVPFVAFSVMINSPDSILTSDTLSNVAFVLLALALGDTVRSRGEARAAEAERRRQAEADAEHEAERRVAEERLRIAREVHDVVAHAMVAINVQAGVAAHVLDQRPEQVRTALTEIKRVSGEALSDLRSTLGLIRDQDASAPRRPTESLTGLDDLAEPLRATGVAVGVVVAGDPAGVPVPVGAAAYRIVQEALTNVLRHAGAQRADVTVAVGPHCVEVDVHDDGAAVPAVGGPAPAGSGNGLRGIAERVDAVGGSLDTGRTADGGWRVHASLPLG